MRYVLPAIFFAAFAVMVVISPHVQPRRLRARAAFVGDELRLRYGFSAGSKASWAEVRATGWPPGVRHRYGLACVMLPHPIGWGEVRGEPVFAAPRVPEHIPDGQLVGAVADFNRAYQIYAGEMDGILALTSRATADAMLLAPERFNWRSLDGEVSLWKRDGWSSADSLIGSVRIVLQILGLVSVEGRV